MKRRTKMLYGVVTLLFLISLLVGCGSTVEEESKGDSSANEHSSESVEDVDEAEETSEVPLEDDKEDHLDSEDDREKNETNDSNEASPKETENNASNETSPNSEGDALAAYSAEEIEYARVWLQLGPNQEVDELNVHFIPAGEPLNPDDATSATYPEDVIQLAGARLVDGSITYHGNGDGTIHVYHVPLRWDGNYPAGEDFYKEIIENTELEYVDPGNDEDVVELINVLNIHS